METLDRKATAKVLVVDDDKEILDAFGDILVEMDYDYRNVRACWNGKLALEMYQKEGPFDLLITDYQMPYMDGLELVRQLFVQYPESELPKHIMMCTGASGRELRDALPKQVEMFSKSSFQAIKEYLKNLEF